MVVNAPTHRLARRLARIPTPIRKALIALVGVALMVAAVLLGPLPGPGGIPLFLAGIAVLASEFTWAHRLWHWFGGLFDRYLAWPRWARITGIGAIVVLAWGGMWTSFAVTGVPTWLPGGVQNALGHLPFVS